MKNLNAEFLGLIEDFECKESYDYFLLGVEYAARTCWEIARSQTSAERGIRDRFDLDDDPLHCYVCDRLKDDCGCEEGEEEAMRLEMAPKDCKCGAKYVTGLRSSENGQMVDHNNQFTCFRCYNEENAGCHEEMD